RRMGILMSEVRQEQPSMLAKADDIQRQIHDLSSRDMQLWSIVSLVILVLTAGFLALIAPNLVWAQRIIHIEQAYLPQLVFGLICLVVLFDIFRLSERVALNSTLQALLSGWVRHQLPARVSLIEPLSY